MRGQVVSLRQRMIEAKFFMTSARPSVFERLAWARRYLSAKVAHSLFLAAHYAKNNEIKCFYFLARYSCLSAHGANLA
jgi:hypothetical protein